MNAYFCPNLMFNDDDNNPWILRVHLHHNNMLQRRQTATITP